jgi:hypothetical protein
LRFVPLRRVPGTGQLLFSEGTSLRVRALAAFLTLSGPCSARYLPALFHAGPAHGVHPPRSISTRRAVRPSGRRYPLEVGRTNQLPSQQLRLPRVLGSLRLPRPSFEGTALRTFGPSSGPCSLRMAVSPRSVV